MMSKIILPILLIAFCSCAVEKKEADPGDATPIYHNNITIAPDLSNRVDMQIHPKPVLDIAIIEKFLSDIEPFYIHTNHRTMNQLDQFHLSFINKGLIKLYNANTSLLEIDFASFKNQGDRIAFVKNRAPYENSGLKEMIVAFKKECNGIYSRAVENTSGADIWTYFNKGIGIKHVRPASAPKLYSKEYFQDRYKNVLVLFTDGYMESGLSANAAQGNSRNLSYDLSQSRVKRFRAAFKQSGMDDMEAFFKENGYGIVPVNNPYLKDLEVIVMEMYDRSLTDAGNATIHPTDSEILELFWSDWLTKSGVKRFELHPCFPDVKGANNAIKNFINLDQ
ncbi:hypothetical protein [Carboxylicivirga sp. N1Y90]|uniref:hypothetical protein n=1 Tax=Carboxylicivirga fragile TaxID=3417571 RepID=UPI003D335565|nr:hypothetical protein [Marinilabiliaceae bacterium N1Y90]